MENTVKRRLAAILAADVVGYSQLMGEDEAGTLLAVRKLQDEVIEPHIVEHYGNLFKVMGDGFLAEFPSVVNAVACAVVIQQTVTARAMGVSGVHQIELRIGVHLGDVIVEKGDVYGDGVNIAVRIEGLSPPGGLAVSAMVHESIGNRLDLAFEDMGDQHLKNIAKPVRVYRLSPMSKRPSGPRRFEMAKSTIAVLPFINLSGDVEQEYFSDGITEDIIIDLSKISGLMVVARNSSFAYKGKVTDIRQVGRDLGVKAVLEGSIRRSGGRVRISAQLIDSTTGGCLWAERYDRELTDIFALQDQVTREIVAALHVKLKPSEQLQLTSRRGGNIEAHDHFLLGRELLFGKEKSRSTFERAVAAFTRAVECDEESAEGFAGLALAYCQEYLNRWVNLPDALGLARQFAESAVAKGPNEPFAQYVAAVVNTWSRNLAEARDSAERALALSPSYALGRGTLAVVKMYQGEPLAAISDLETAMRLDPVYTQHYLHFLGTAYLLCGKFDESAVAFRERIRLAPNTDISRALLASVLGHLGEVDEARRVWAEIKTLNPGYSFEEHMGHIPFQNSSQGDVIVSGLAKAALPA